MARSSRAKASEGLSTAIKLLAPSPTTGPHEGRGTRSQVHGHPSARPPDSRPGSELLKTRLHTAYLTGIEKGPVISPVREMERPAAAPSPRALSRKGTASDVPPNSRTTVASRGHEVSPWPSPLDPLGVRGVFILQGVCEGVRDERKGEEKGLRTQTLLTRDALDGKPGLRPYDLISTGLLTQTSVFVHVLQDEETTTESCTYPEETLTLVS